MGSTFEGTETSAHQACRHPKGCALSDLAAHALCSQKADAGPVSVRELRGEGVAIYITLRLLMRELTLGQPTGRTTRFMS